MPSERSIILLVEDDPNDAHLAQRALQRAGASQEILHLQDGEEAINYLSGKPPFGDRSRYPMPSLVLLDLKMPRMSGFDVLAWLQGHPELAALPVVVTVRTGSIEPQDVVNAKRLGAVGYEVKPIDFGKLVEIAKGIDSRWLGESQKPTG